MGLVVCSVWCMVGLLTLYVSSRQRGIGVLFRWWVSGVSLARVAGGDNAALGAEDGDR